MGNMEQPLVTFALFAYNQKMFIREAIEGALAQSYSPLEIILSDDCSTDGTFDLIRDIVATYSGPHSIRLNRNPANLGIAGHLNFLMSLVKSDFVVVAAGDDISLPDRTVKLVSAWLNSGRQMKSIHSYAADMNEHGELTGNLRRGSEDSKLSSPFEHSKTNIGVLGATHGWDMSLINNFQPILESVVNEDVILPARASITGCVGFVSETLVKYRVGVGVSHEVSRRRASGVSTLSIALLKRPYFSSLQKFRDYKEYGVLDAYRTNFQKMRAETSFPIWLRIGHFSGMKFVFFLRRCSLLCLLWETTKFKLPKMVAIKQRIQFDLAELVGKIKKISFF